MDILKAIVIGLVSVILAVVAFKFLVGITKFLLIGGIAVGFFVLIISITKK